MSDLPPSGALAELCHQAALLCRAGAEPPSRLRITCGDMNVEMEWPHPGTSRSASPEQAVAPPDGSAHEVCAPMVGTFYLAPEPGAAPFVREGDSVAAGQQIGIIEAMKLMNEIVAEHAGTVTRILLPDATAVEYGQPLMLLSPA